jgi:hypothetical protein
VAWRRRAHRPLRLITARIALAGVDILAECLHMARLHSLALGAVEATQGLCASDAERLRRLA